MVFVHKLKKRKWLPDEDTKIKKYFDLENVTPSLEQCALFVNLHKRRWTLLQEGWLKSSKTNAELLRDR